MIVAAVRHPVKDYDQWKAVFDQYPPTEAGALFARLILSLNCYGLCYFISFQ